MNKKFYECPEMQLCFFEGDVVASSGGVYHDNELPLVPLDDSPFM